MAGIIINSVYIVGILCLAGASFAHHCMEPWDSLEHTFDPENVANRLLKKGTNIIPRMRKINHSLRPTCINKVGKATYYGYRRQVRGDVNNNIVALYDKNGIIAGMQVRFNKSALYDGWDNKFRYDRVPMFQTEKTAKATYFVLTAYFVEPSTICTEGRTLDDLNSANGTGYTLLFQNGPTPKNLLVAPRRRPQALQMGYSNNVCIDGMGNHTFYRVESYQAKNCNEMTPVFLLHNVREEGCLIGFGFVLAGRAVSDILEQPSGPKLESIAPKGQFPQCFADLYNRRLMTQIHIFFTRRSIGCSGANI